MSKQPGTRSGDPIRTYRAPDDVYDPALEVATERGEKLSPLINAFLIGYVKDHRTTTTTTTTEETSK